MKQKIFAASAAALLLAAVLGAALAAPGTGSDPLVTLDYLTGTYYEQAEQAMEERARAGTAAAEQAAFDRLDQLAEGYLAQAGSAPSSQWDHAASFTRLSLSGGDVLTLGAGAGVLYEAGSSRLEFRSGALVDVTAGSLLISGGSLSAGHRYVAAENAACTVTAVSDAVILSVQGDYTLDRAGASLTPFTDVSPSDWYYTAVQYTYQNQLYAGMTPTTFGPGIPMSRAMLATVLSRLAGVNGPAPSMGFTDVADGAWYADAVNWAAWSKVVEGMGGNRFSPDANVTREQMAVMLYRYAHNYLGLSLPSAGDLSAYTDGAAVSSWAEEALAWAVGRGILTGYTDGTIRPGGTASRAEVAVMLQRFAALLP